MQIDLDSFALGFTQSEITTWDDCAEKWFLGYNQLLRRKGEFAWYFVYGDAFHRSLSEFYRTGEMTVASLQFPRDVILTNEQEADKDKWEKILAVQMERYAVFYADDLKAWKIHLNEEIVTTEFEGITFTGKIDLGLTIKGEKSVVHVDHKSASQFSPASMNGWHFRFQFMFYLWLVRRVTGKPANRFMVNGLKKPGLKQGVNETVDSYVARVRVDMIQRPEEYFKRITLPTIAGSMETFEEKVLRPKINRIKALTLDSTPVMIKESLARNLNTNNCVKFGQTCQFLPICQNGWKAEGFQYARRENKHEELEPE